MPRPQAGVKPMYTGTWDCFTKTVKLEGFKGLYKGRIIIIFHIQVSYSYYVIKILAYIYVDKFF